MRLPTIGLEIHAELKTKTKMFCSCPNDPDERHPNINVCPICLGHPGTLPTINKEAVSGILKLGLALGGKITPQTYFDRKSYFYPDNPKGFQISQYEHPLVEGGRLMGVRIRRVHLEEDAGRLLHELSGISKKQRASFVDFNRAGLPLLELVTEPDIKNSEEAVNFAKELQLIMRYLGISNADMEKGQMRVEANVSLSVGGGMGTKVEVKNINSFKAVYDAIEYELKRQEEALKNGEEVIQETRGWNEKKKMTESQRSKESAHDYRYFPEPDLPPFDTGEFNIEELKMKLRELPEAKRHRFIKEFGLSLDQVQGLVENVSLANYFEEAASELKSLKGDADYNLLWNYMTSDLKGLLNEQEISINDIKISPEHFAHLVAMVSKKELSSRLAKNLLIKMFETGDDPEVLKNTGKVTLISNENELELIAQEIIEKNPKAVADYKKGKETAVQFLVGQAMAKTRGQAEPEVLRELFKKLLG